MTFKAELRCRKKRFSLEEKVRGQVNQDENKKVVLTTALSQMRDILSSTPLTPSGI